MTTTRAFYPFMIQHIISFLDEEGYFVFLNHEWKREYIRQYKEVYISSLNIRTVERYNWAITYGYRCIHARDVNRILKSRIFHQHEEIQTEKTLTDALIQTGHIRDVINYALVHTDIHVFLRAYDHAYMLLDSEIENDYCTCTYFNLLSFVRGIHDKVHYRSFLIHGALRLALQCESYDFIDFYYSHFKINPKVSRGLLIYAFHHHYDEAILLLVQKYKASCGSRIKREIIMHDNLSGFRLLISLQVIQHGERIKLLCYAIQMDAMQIVRHMIAQFVFTREELHYSLQLAHKWNRNEIAHIMNLETETV